MKLGVGLTVAAIAGVVAAATAAAQVYPPGQWHRSCNADRATDTRPCAMEIVLLPATAPADQVIMVRVDTVNSAVLITGTGDGGSARVRIDGNPAVSAASCDRSTCVLAPPLARSVLRQMQIGSVMRVEFVDIQGQRSGPFETPLGGFSQQRLLEGPVQALARVGG